MSLREQLCGDVWLDVCKYFSVWTVVNVHCFNDDVSGLMVFNIPAHSPGLRPKPHHANFRFKRHKRQKYVHTLSPGHQETKRGIHQPNYTRDNRTKTHCVAHNFKCGLNYEKCQNNAKNDIELKTYVGSSF